jgi:hypothetical protein
MDGERVTHKQLQTLVGEVNAKRNTDLIVFPNMYGYGIAESDRMGTNVYRDYFKGKARECEGFLLGMLCEPVTKSK